MVCSGIRLYRVHVYFNGQKRCILSILLYIHDSTALRNASGQIRSTSPEENLVILIFPG